jgi:hypothetical protein
LSIDEQCGGKDWTGSGTCAKGLKCKRQNAWYSQCTGDHAAFTKIHLPTDTSTDEEEKTPTFFCFSLVAPNTYETAVMATQLQLQAGLFACDGHLVISNVTADVLFTEKHLAERIPVSVIQGSMWVPLTYGPHGHAHALNGQVFRRAWDLLFLDGAYEKYDWTIKLDVDAVIIPPRVRFLLRDRPKRDGVYEPMYLLNAGQDAVGNLLHGPAEVLSTSAMKRFKVGIGQCRELLNSSQMGEDLWLNKCLQLLKVPGVQELRLLQDAYMWGKKHVECQTDQAVFHPLKTPQEWSRCVAQIGKPAVAVSLAAVRGYDDKPLNHGPHGVVASRTWWPCFAALLAAGLGLSALAFRTAATGYLHRPRGRGACYATLEEEARIEDQR